ncbi:ABC transporter C family member 3-like [Aristolochia californica]|uniref:ABC transporter C family member 3-like n=1 Tax=Aristolochia californica TaxID=171875 RepID=UPI0035E088DF
MLTGSMVSCENHLNGTFFFFCQSVLNSKTVSSVLREPTFLLHGLSVLSSLVLLLVLSLTCACKSFNLTGSPQLRNERPRNSSFLHYTATLLTTVGLSLFYLSLCIFTYFWYKDGWCDEKLFVQSDLMLRTLVWAAISAFLYFKFSNSLQKQFPTFLRIWWCLYLTLSCSSLVIDIIYLSESRILAIHVWVLDSVSVVTSLFLCYAGFFGRENEEEATLLHEPLLNGDAKGACESDGKDNITPYANANFLSVLTFSWMGSLLKVGSRKALDLDDVPQLASADSVKGLFPIFKAKLEQETECSNDHSSGTATTNNEVGTMKLAKTLLFSLKRDIVWTALVSITYTVASYAGPYLIEDFVRCLNGQQKFANEGYALVSAFFIAKIVECLAQRLWFFRLQVVGIRVRAVLIAMIYRKGLTLSMQSRQSHTSGEIINFMTVDAERVGDFSWYMHDLWMIPLQVGLALLILYKNLGLASVAALVATILIMLANAPLGKLQENYQEKLMKSKDVRMKATSEILRNMRVLKLQAWEMKFLSKITELRNNEANWLKKYLYTTAIVTFVFWGAPTFVSVVTFGSCMLMGIPLESGKILSALATFRILQEPIYNLPDTISMVVQTKVSLDRISSFVRLKDLQPDVVEKLPRDSSDVAVEVSNGVFSWDPSSEIPTLKDLNFRVSHGMRVAVCGIVGSGKSSLLSCILGEVPKISGTVTLRGTKAYVSQSPWIQSGKIVDNVLFGKEMNRERYDSVLEACSLKKDLEILPFGDQTVIGERGINLSGGQKQRIQIARALYQDSDIYLFDDPFSAVDAHTGTHLFKECLLGILGSKTVIYVTHQVEFLPAADLILVMKEGRITQAGKYEEILASGTDFVELVNAHNQALLSLVDSKSSEISEEDGPHCAESSTQALSGEGQKREESSKTDEIGGQNGQLVQEEEREKGRVSLSVYWKYLNASYGGALVPCILLAQILFQVLQIGSNYWMAWASPVSKNTEPPVGGVMLILVYVVLALGSSLCILLRAVLLVTAGYKTATILFNKMHLAVFRAPMSFFDSTPSGRILNRASTDQSAVDMQIPFHIGSFAFSMIQLVGIIAVMSQVAWEVFLIFIPVGAICLWYQQYYIPTSRELARLIGVCKAPNIQHFAESLSGSSTIRSFDQEARFIETNYDLIDGYARPKFHNAGAMEWLCFRLDMFSSLTFAFSLIFLISMPKGIINPGIAGLAVTYGLNLNMILAWVIWNLCNLENKIISVERIFQYASIPSEPPLVIETSRPDLSWPSYGEVDIRGLQVRYAAHMPLVLKGLTCVFPGGLKTGIVGRTGSGKSTLIQALFRIVDPTAGQILIDGINISTIGLHDLRSRLSIIPQDPTMFEGTVRSNLDPLEEHTDEQIWEALDGCQLGEEIRRKEGKLDSSVAENGENWSVGQRQLVCLGRVLLKKSKILVLDEATASVDTATDNLIQQTLRQHFADSSVITIAHRITSVIDSDVVALLDNGMIEEFDSPAKLLENKSSLFSKLVAEYTSRSSSSFEELVNVKDKQ